MPAANETARRLDAVRANLKKTKLDGYLILDRANTTWLADFECSSSFILLTADEAWFITDFRYIEIARKTMTGLEVKLQKNPVKDLARLVKGAGVKRLGVEKNLPYGTALEYQEAFKGVEFVADDTPVDSVRARKSPGEVDALRESQHRISDAFHDLAADAQEGWSEIDIRNRIRRLIERYDGAGESFDSIVAGGPNSSRPHARAGARKLKRGDVVQIDTGMLYQRYCSDLSRVVCVGRPDDKMKKIHRIVLDAQLKAIDAVRAGKTCKELDQVARDYITKKGYGKHFGHGLGHGVGLEIHEAPSVNPRSEEKLEEGMAITIEPGIYLPGWGGIRIEDVVIVKRNGCENITTARKDLVSI